METIQRSPRPGDAWMLLVLAMAGGGVAWARAARHDVIACNPDAIVYVESAGNLLQGRGLTAVERNYSGSPTHRFRDEPLTHYPPLLPLLIAGVSACGLSPSEAAGWLNTLVMAASMLVLTHVVYRASGAGMGCALAAGAMFLASATTFQMHTEALSEPVFVLLSVSGLAALWAYLERGRGVWLVAAAVLAALAWQTRYVGAALVGAGAAALLFRPGASLRRRLAEASGFCAAASLPMVGWMIRNRLVAGTATHRPIAFHPPLARTWQSGLDALRHWFAPHETPRAVQVVGLCLLAVTVAALVVAIGRRRAAGGGGLPPSPRIVKLMGLFAGVYLLVLVASATFVDARIPFNSRTLFPLYPCLIVAVCSLAGPIYRACGRPERVLMACSAAALVLTGGWSAVAWGLDSRQRSGTPAASWMYSDTMRQVAAMAPDAAVYTNAGMAVEYQTGRRVFGLPTKRDAMSDRPRAEYPSEMAALREGLRKPGSRLVLFRPFWPPYYPSEKELLKAADVEAVSDEGPCAIFQARRP